MSAAVFVGGESEPAVPESVDVLIVGSGPVGSAYARVITDLLPHAQVLMVEAGPRLTDRAGMHMLNITDVGEREQARRRSEGPLAAQGPADRTFSLLAQDDGPTSSPGTFYVDPAAAREGRAGTLPAAAMSCNVGGMGSHWAAATPAPRGRERIDFIPEAEWARLLATAQQLLSVTSEPSGGTPTWRETLAILAAEFDHELPAGGGIRDMPVARRSGEPGTAPYWTGPDVILGDLARAPRDTFAIAADTLCRELLWAGQRVRGAVLEHRPSGKVVTVSAEVVVVAADSLRTPQLLWASGIRPDALGHSLNDHALVGAFLSPAHLQAPGNPAEFFVTAINDPNASIHGGWVPYADGVHALHGQFSQFELPAADGSSRPQGLTVFGYFLPKDIRFKDRVVFLDDQPDVFGMPGITFEYGLTEQDRAALEYATSLIHRAASALGAGDHEVVRQPDGSSLHYMGTVRMGEHNDGQSVCDSQLRVWGFENLFVGGNGVIPTAIACNPTLTSVTLAVRGAERVVGLLERAMTSRSS